MPMSMREVLHAPHPGLSRNRSRRQSRKKLDALQHWLPAIGAEVLLLVAFLAWIRHRGVALHGNAVVYAWAVYGLIALGLLFLWVGPVDRGQGSGHASRQVRDDRADR